MLWLCLTLLVIVEGVSLPCQRLPAGSSFSNATLRPQLRSSHGYLTTQITFTKRSFAGTDSESPFDFFCYMMADGINESPILRVQANDHLIVTLVNEVESGPVTQLNETGSCGSTVLTPTSTNIHFHGLHELPVCHRDEVIKTIVNSGESFTYDFLIPPNQPPGLFWYHPHVHGLTDIQVSGGATGVYIIEGIEKLQPAVGGLPEVIFVFRDEVVHNTTDNGNMPFKDLTLNSIPIYYPDYPTIDYLMKPNQTQFWRIANTASGSTLNLQLIYDDVVQTVQVVSRDGVTLNVGDSSILETATDLFLPPASRLEIIMRGPSSNVNNARLITTSFDTGPDGDNNPFRPLATIRTDPQAPDPPQKIPAAPSIAGQKPRNFVELVNATVDATRTLIFSEVVSNPADPTSPTVFFVTVDGKVPKPYNRQNAPDIVTTQGSVEDWTIVNRAKELHAFHIHQLHFLLLQKNGVPVNRTDMQYYDSINVDYWSGNASDPFPNITIRLDFSGNKTGRFVYHCHYLEHEDSGMMAIIEVLPLGSKVSASEIQPLSATAIAAILLGTALVITLFVVARYCRLRSQNSNDGHRHVEAELTAVGAVATPKMSDP